MTNVRSSLPTADGVPVRPDPPTRRVLLLVLVAVPVVVLIAVAAFCWPSARLAPRDLPVGVVASGPAATAADHLSADGVFDVHRYADLAAARAAVATREVDGAFVFGLDGVTVLTASAASPTVAQLLAQAGAAVAAQSPAGGAPHVVDVVPISPEDPRGVVLASAVLPLVICGQVVAAVLALALGFASPARQLLALAVATGLVATVVYVVVQPWLGALPGGHWATWASLWLVVAAITATTVGLYELLGLAGFAAGAGLMVFVGNPFSGVTSSPDLLPAPAGALGRAMPPGAGADLLRSTAYFGGHGAGAHVVVLASWLVVAACLVGAGHALRRRREGRGAPPAPAAQAPAS